MARVRAVDGNTATSLTTGWECASVSPGAVADAAGLEGVATRWYPARVPGTAASSLAAASAWSFDQPRDFDADDWWFRAVVPPDAVGDGRRLALRFDSLATLADVWLDGQHVLRSESMFVEREVDVTGKLHAGSRIAIRFASVAEELKKRRPRPRWRSRLVAQQQLRWLRTTLVGRIPSWTPPAAPVGPCGPVVLEAQRSVRVLGADVRPRLSGHDGICEASVTLVPLDGRVESVTLRVGSHEAALRCEAAADGAVTARGSVTVPAVALWWPSTHGEPVLHDVSASVKTSSGTFHVDLGRTGFRALDLDTADGAFGLRINGADVFCRGAVWTPTDVVSMTEDPEDLRATLESVRAAGMNMLRVCGTMTYPSEAFVDACDEAGILLWHDFMFATLDYPATDAAFVQSVRDEAAQAASRLQLSPSTAVLCGNTEGQQQVAMLGLPAEDRRSLLFDEILPGIAAEVLPGIPYLPSTPTGGPLPFRVDTGVSHYYGVGAYKRPFDDARRSRVRFTSECLGFANVPSTETIDALLDGESPIIHPRWKTRVPRDRGTSWDFDDVRDHYLRELFAVDPAELRAVDASRYLELGRLASAEAMAAAFTEWRRSGSDCRGALVWFLRDLWPGAGWGIIEASGRPKAPYYFLRRLLQPTGLVLTDEGLNGHAVHVVNDTGTALDARVRFELFRDGEIAVASGVATLHVEARGVAVLHGDAILDRFADTAYAYRFGPPGHDLVVATLLASGSDRILGQAFAFPTGRDVTRRDLGVDASAATTPEGDLEVVVSTRRFAYALAFDAPGFVAADDFFHLPPGSTVSVRLRRDRRARGGAGVRVCAANALAASKIRVAPPG